MQQAELIRDGHQRQDRHEEELRNLKQLLLRLAEIQARQQAEIEALRNENKQLNQRQIELLEEIRSLRMQKTTQPSRENLAQTYPVSLSTSPGSASSADSFGWLDEYTLKRLNALTA